MDFEIDDLQAEDGKHIYNVANADLALPGSEFDEAYDELFTPQQSILPDDDSSFLSDSSAYIMSTANTETFNNKFNSDGERKFKNHKFDSDPISNDDISCTFDLSFNFNIDASDDVMKLTTVFAEKLEKL
jgi:hypothetical protein